MTTERIPPVILAVDDKRESRDRLQAELAGRYGHFDVVDMRGPLPEAFELVEDGVITEADFRDFVFANAVRLWGTQNPRFFEGTAVAKEAAAVLKGGAPTRDPAG